MQFHNVLTWIYLSLYFNVICAVIPKDERDNRLNSCVKSLLKGLPEFSFSASSVLRNESEFKPGGARMESIYEMSPRQRAWCPHNKVSSRPSEWLQVDFEGLKVITNMFTRGRDDGNYGEYVTSYYFDYQREDGMTWYRYRDDDLGEVMKGNNDARNPAHMGFVSPLVAKRIRIIPISHDPQMVCLKIFLYGCDFKDGVVEYRIPRGYNVDVDDDRYDGRGFSNNVRHQSGMGKLMDNVISINLSVQNTKTKFAVAWDQNIEKTDYVELLFRFDTFRIHRAVHLYPAINSSFSLSPCKALKIQFLKTGVELKDNDISVELFQSQLDVLQPIKISLQNKTANVVKIHMFFNSRRMGLNEIMFQSDPVNVPTLPLKPPDSVSTRVMTEDSPHMIINITVITCSAIAIFLVIVLTIVCILWIRQKNRRRYKNKLCDYRSLFRNDPSYPTNVGNINTISCKDSVHYRSNDGQIFGFSYVHPSYPPCQDYRAHTINNSNEYEPIDSYWPKPPSQNTLLLKDATVGHSDGQSLKMAIGSDIPHVFGGGIPTYGSSSTYSSYPYDVHLPIPDIIPSIIRAQGTLTDIFNIHKINPLKGLMGSSMACCHSTPPAVAWIDAAMSRLLPIPIISITLEKHVSEGHLAQIRSGTIDECKVGVIIAEMKTNHISSEIKRYAFYRQCFLAMKEDFSSHPNLLPFIGQSQYQDISASIVYAYPSQITAVSFFERLRQISKTNSVNFTSSCVSQDSLLFLMKQLADALTFLSDAGVVHRDVAARNCTIGHRLHLVLSDFAMGFDEFQDDYIELSSVMLHDSSDSNLLPNSVRLPLLWMPWEAIINGNYSSKSDVWSFGVTLWEIFTECQLKPYSMTLPVSNKDPGILIHNSKLISHSHPSSILPNGRTLDQTCYVYDKGSHSDINQQVRDIMHSCWEPNPDMRPNFHKLYSIFSDFNPDSRFMDEDGALQSLMI